MEQNITGALERITNPILIILLAVLLVAIWALWMRDQQNRKSLLEVTIQSIQAVTNANATLSAYKERMDRIEEELSLLRKKQ